MLQASPRGLLRIAVPVTFGVLYGAPAVSDYMTHPEFRIDIVVSDPFVNLIEEGFEVAIRIGELQESGLIVRRLASARPMVCTAPSYLQRAGRPETPADLSRHACLINTETATPETWRFPRSRWPHGDGAYCLPADLNEPRIRASHGPGRT